LTLKLEWTAAADDALYEILDYISDRTMKAALDLAHAIRGCLYPSLEFPNLFAEGVEPGTREIVAHPNYIVVYEFDDTTLRVLDVRHARRKFPPDHS